VTLVVPCNAWHHKVFGCDILKWMKINFDHKFYRDIHNNNYLKLEHET